MMMRDVEKRGCVRKRGDGVDVAIIAIVVVVGYYWSLVEASAVAAVNVHVAAKGLCWTELPSTEAAVVESRRPGGAHHVTCVFCEGSDLPGLILIFMVPWIPHPTGCWWWGCRKMRGGVRVFCCCCWFWFWWCWDFDKFRIWVTETRPIPAPMVLKLTFKIDMWWESWWMWEQRTTNFWTKDWLNME